MKLESPSRRTFAVGRPDRRTTEVQVVEPRGSAPIPGPWSLKAVVRERRPELRVLR